jgi:hypothetical protein
VSGRARLGTVIVSIAAGQLAAFTAAAAGSTFYLALAGPEPERVPTGA